MTKDEHASMSAAAASSVDSSPLQQSSGGSSGTSSIDSSVPSYSLPKSPSMSSSSSLSSVDYSGVNQTKSLVAHGKGNGKKRARSSSVVSSRSGKKVPVKRRRRDHDEDGHHHSATSESESDDEILSKRAARFLFKQACRVQVQQALENKIRGRQFEEKRKRLAKRHEAYDEKIRRLEREIASYPSQRQEDTTPNDGSQAEVLNPESVQLVREVRDLQRKKDHVMAATRADLGL